MDLGSSLALLLICLVSRWCSAPEYQNLPPVNKDPKDRTLFDDLWSME